MCWFFDFIFNEFVLVVLVVKFSLLVKVTCSVKSYCVSECLFMAMCFSFNM